MIRTIAFYILVSCLYYGSLSAQPAIVMSKALNGSGAEQQRMIRELRKYPADEFSAADKSRISNKILDQETLHRADYFLLAGFLGLAEDLAGIDPSTLRTEKQKRNHGLAMVRAGDASKARILLKNLRGLDYNDDFVYDLVPLLIYTHDRLIYDYLIELSLQSNQNCLPPDPHAEGQIDCGYRMMEYLAPVLVDYPFDLGPSGDLEVADYRASLVTVREWLKRHRKDYEIISNRY